MTNKQPPFRLYHGGIAEVKHINISNSRNRLDFGKGFYTTANYEQAKRWAILKFNRSKNQNIQKAVSKYIFEDYTDLQIKEFPVANKDWLEFVVRNRRGELPAHNYDLVIGQIANDTTLLVVNAYMDGLYGKGQTATEMAINLLKPEMLQTQFAFCTANAASRLIFKGCDFL